LNETPVCVVSDSFWFVPVVYPFEFPTPVNEELDTPLSSVKPYVSDLLYEFVFVEPVALSYVAPTPYTESVLCPYRFSLLLLIDWPV
ncbi:hypothetical protein, partial [Acinetobacter baumannii]|uniref:hypothetical protein n=1 Tax=Acinetobacter baumannii TaxID=470 RepID=UPI001D0D4B05